MARLALWRKPLIEFALLTGYRPEALFLEARRLAKQSKLTAVANSAGAR